MEGGEVWQMIETLAQFGTYLRQCRRQRGLTLDQLAAATGISKPYLSNLETARAAGPASPQKLMRLEVALGRPEGELIAIGAWLKTPESMRALLRTRIAGHGAPPAGASAASPSAPEGLPVQSVPLINRVAAGPAAEYTDLDYPTGIADRYVPIPVMGPAGGGAAKQAGRKRGGAFALRVEGESMLPDYRPGDVVILAAEEIHSGDDCLVRLDDRENFATTLKRVFFEPSEEEAVAVRLVPLNRAFPERVVPLERVTGLYPVIWKLQPVWRSKGERFKQ